MRANAPPGQPLHFWRRLVNEALASSAPTPFYLFSVEPVQAALAELSTLERSLPIPLRPWLSCKTQPVRPLVRWWQAQDRGIEVVSEFELLAALREGFAPDRILVNGPAKHAWLGQHAVEGMRVNFDSPTEIRALLPLARRLNWSVGVRCQTQQEHDPDNPRIPTQFGMQAQEAVRVLKQLQRSGVRLETIHFHLRTNVESPAVYDRALSEIAALCRAAAFEPKFLDCGGGYPAPHVLSPEGLRYDLKFNWPALAELYTRALKHFTQVQELWLENGRFLTARSGVLVVRILDIKDRARLRHLICDGGRTLNALVSAWETHQLFSVPARRGQMRPTAVCGPTCMAFDQLTRRALPNALRIGDCLVWMDAGAYHIPWETRFSHGRCGVYWHENNRLSLVRRPEPFDAWWNQWEGAPER
jgi:diaminopimelate decarboxylase